MTSPTYRFWFWFRFILRRPGLTWSIVLRCDDHTGIFTCDGCDRDTYFYVPAETQSYMIKLSCSRKSPCRQRGLNSAPLGYNDLESATLSTAPARHIKFGIVHVYVGWYILRFNKHVIKFIIYM